MTPKDRVRLVLDVSRRIADGTDALGREARSALGVTSGLSPEGIELALTEHLERDATEAELDAFCREASRASNESLRIFVVLSANVCVAPARAVAFALAAAPRVFVKPSRRDPTLAAILTRELRSRVELGEVAGLGDLVEGDAVHAYGSDETLASIAGGLPRSVAFYGHGTGFGLAVVGGGDDVEHSAEAIARDVVPFDQQGCLSPRVVIVEGGASAAERFVEAVDAALAALGARIPRGCLDEGGARDLAAYVETMRAIGSVVVRTSHVVALDRAPRTLLLPPAYRAVHVAAVERGQASALIGPVARYVTSIGASGSCWSLEDLIQACPGARRANLGEMQRPPFDGPVDLRARPAFPRRS